jgi:hypothetical protein
MLQIYYTYAREWEQLLFLHRDFNSKYFYWELIEVCRKLMLVSVSVIVGNYAPGYDLVFGIVTLCLFFAVHVYAQPYKKSKHNFLKAAEMFAEYMTLFISMLMLLALATNIMPTSFLGKTMLMLQGLVGAGLVIVVYFNLKEGIAELQKTKAREERLGIIARVENVYITCV